MFFTQRAPRNLPVVQALFLALCVLLVGPGKAETIVSCRTQEDVAEAEAALQGELTAMKYRVPERYTDANGFTFNYTVSPPAPSSAPGSKSSHHSPVNAAIYWTARGSAGCSLWATGLFRSL